ncbi:MAG: transcriptional regulator [Verrucomicrobiota bacterium]
MNISTSAPKNLNGVLRQYEELPPDALIRIGAVTALESCSASTIWRRIRAGIFPKPIRQVGVTAWRVGDLRAHHARLREPV